MVHNSKGVNLEGLEQIFRLCGKDVGKAALDRRVADFYEEADKVVAAFLRRMEVYDAPKLKGDAASDNNKEPKRVRTKPKKTARPRELMTLMRKGALTDGHLMLLHSKLTSEGWIDCFEGDFKALFSGKRDEKCQIVWTGAYGKSTLVELFARMVSTGNVVVPAGYSLVYILEGHFKDKQGEWLTGLDKGDKPNNKALPFIHECVTLVKASVDKLLNSQFEDDDEYDSAYDSFDHQDLTIHRRH